MTARSFRRAIAANDAATAASGSVTVNVGPGLSLLSVGRAKVFSQKANRYDPDDAVTGQCVQITAVSATGVTMTLGAAGTTPRAVNPGDFILMEDGITEILVDGSASTSGLQTAITLAATALLPVVITSNLTLTTTSITWPATGNVELYGLPGVTVRAPASGAGNLLVPAGTRSAASALTANALRLANAIVHTPADAARLFAVGDMIEIIDNATRSHVSRVEAVSASTVGAPQTVTFSDTLSVNMLTANAASAYKQAPIPGLYVHDLNFDANGNTGLVRLIVASRLLNPRWQNLRFKGFKGTGAASLDEAGAFSDEVSYNSLWRGHRYEDCGTLGLSAMRVSSDTRSRSEDIDFLGGGFGYASQQNNHYTMESVKASYTRGRAIAIGANIAGAGSHDGVLIDCWGNNTQGGGTGIEFRGGSTWADLFGCGAYNNGSAGLYIVGANSESNIVDHGGRYYGAQSSADLQISNVGGQPAQIGFDKTRYGTRDDSGLSTRWDTAVGGAGIATATATVTETAIWQEALQGGMLGYGGKARLHLAGYISNNTGADRTFVLRVKLIGTTTMFQDTTIPIPASANARPFSIDMTLRNNVGVTNAQTMDGTLSLGDITAPAAGQGNISALNLLSAAPFRGTSAEDSTAALTWGITVEMSANDFTVAPDVAVLELVN